MEKKVLVPLAEGFETIEALAVVDVFRRGGVQVDLAAIGDNLQVTSSQDVPVIADRLLADCVEDKNCVTSKGAGTSIEFGLELLEILMGEEKKKEVAKGMAL